MPQPPVESNDRMSLRIASEDKSLLMRAAAIQHSNLTEFAVRHLVSLARKIVEENERVQVSEKDSLQIMALLDNPPAPNEKLMKAAFALPKSA